MGLDKEYSFRVNLFRLFRLKERRGEDNFYVFPEWHVQCIIVNDDQQDATIFGLFIYS